MDQMKDKQHKMQQLNKPNQSTLQNDKIKQLEIHTYNI